MFPCTYGICVIYNMFCAILIQYFTQNLFIVYVNSIHYVHFITVETMIWLKFLKCMFYTWKLGYVLLFSHCIVNMSIKNIDRVVSMLFFQRRSNVNEKTLTQFSFLTKYQCWNNIGSSTLNRRNSINVVSTVNFVSTLFCHRWNNVHNIRRLNRQFQLNINVETTLVHWHWNVVILLTLFQRCFANVQTKSINIFRLNVHFQPIINVETKWNNVVSTLI